MNANEISLFDVENVKTQPKVRDMVVGPVSTRDVNEFARRYHYSGHKGAASWRFGLWDGFVLHGVVAYNLPTRQVAESVFGPEYQDHIWHMGRLILSDDSPRNSESRLIGGSLRLIAEKFPHVWAVLTYAATDVGHIGTVYQATNAIYTGTGKAVVYFKAPDGTRRGTKDGQGWITREQAEERGWTVHQGGIKHRYIYILGNKTQRRQRRALLCYPVLPYPKQSAS